MGFFSRFFSRKKEDIQAPIDEVSVQEYQPDIYQEIADDLEIEVELLKAFVKVEAGSKNDLDGRVIIRWETHIFKRKTGINILVHGARGRINKECQDNEHESFERACTCAEAKYSNTAKAYESASWGIGQIMGFHYKRLGFKTPQELTMHIAESKDNGLRMIGKFIKTNSRLLKACREKDYHRIAYYYNGAYYERYAPEGSQYDDKIEKYYKQLKEIT